MGNLSSTLRDYINSIIECFNKLRKQVYDTLTELCDDILHQLKIYHDNIHQWAKENPELFALIVGILVVAGVTGVTVGLLAAVGFASGGILPGSIAAAIHSSIGNVTAGSLFAVIQSLTATPAIWAVGSALGALTAVIGGFFWFGNKGKERE